MGTDEIKGRVKEAAGVALDDGELEREGKMDRLKGKAHDTLDAAAEKVEEVAEKVSERLHRD